MGAWISSLSHLAYLSSSLISCLIKGQLVDTEFRPGEKITPKLLQIRSAEDPEVQMDLTVPDTQTSDSQTSILNWHLFKSGLRLEPTFEKMTETPEMCMETFFRHYEIACHEFKAHMN